MAVYEPKKAKYRKQQRNFSNHVIAYNGNTLQIGSVGLQVLEQKIITSRQLEAGRKTISRHSKSIVKTYVRVLTDKPMTALATEVKLGKGKRAICYGAFNAKAGKVIYEIRTSNITVAIEALNKVGYELGIKTKVIVQDQTSIEDSPVLTL